MIVHAGEPVRLEIHLPIGSTTFRETTTLVLSRVKNLVHYEIGIFSGKTLAYVTLQPTTDYTAEMAKVALREIRAEIENS